MNLNNQKTQYLFKLNKLLSIQKLKIMVWIFENANHEFVCAKLLAST